MIRILHVIDSLDLGGGQTALLNLVRFANRSRFEIEVASLHGHGVFREAFEELNIRVHSLSPQRWSPLYVPRLIHLLRKHPFQIVHCHLNAANWIAKPIAAACGVRIRFTHDQCNDEFRSKNPLITLLDAITNRLSSVILTVSQSINDYLLIHERLDPSRVRLLPNSVDTNHFQPADWNTKVKAKQQLGFEPDCLLIAGIGRLVPQKKFPIFLSAFSLLLQQHPKSSFFIAGTGPEETRLRQLASQLGIAHRGRFLGFYSDTQSLYQACDILLFPSSYEGLPLTVLEAMASGVPVVASAVDGLRDLIQHGENGLLSASNQPANFSKLLLDLCNSSEKQNRIAKAARSHIEAHYEAKTLTRQLENLYLEALSSNS